MSNDPAADDAALQAYVRDLMGRMEGVFGDVRRQIEAAVASHPEFADSGLMADMLEQDMLTMIMFYFEVVHGVSFPRRQLQPAGWPRQIGNVTIWFVESDHAYRPATLLVGKNNGTYRVRSSLSQAQRDAAFAYLLEQYREHPDENLFIWWPLEAGHTEVTE